MLLRDLERPCEVACRAGMARVLRERVVVEEVGAVAMNESAAVSRRSVNCRARLGGGQEKTHNANPSCHDRENSLTSTSSYGAVRR